VGLHFPTEAPRLRADDLQMNTPRIRHRGVDRDRVGVRRRQRHRVKIKGRRGARCPCLQDTTRRVQVHHHVAELIIGGLDRDLLACGTGKRIATTLASPANHDLPGSGINLK
jgi:hypothetical protein